MLGDRYRLDDRIAAGGMGEVWQATDTVLGRDVAVKTLHAGRAADPGFQTRFRHEARAMAALHHPGVADSTTTGRPVTGWTRTSSWPGSTGSR
jgi:serine/threonine-protein kinase